MSMLDYLLQPKEPSLSSFADTFEATHIVTTKKSLAFSFDGEWFAKKDALTLFDEELAQLQTISHPWLLLPVDVQEEEHKRLLCYETFSPGKSMHSMLGMMRKDSVYQLFDGLLDLLTLFHDAGLSCQFSPEDLYIKENPFSVQWLRLPRSFLSITTKTPPGGIFGLPGFRSPAQVEGEPMTPAEDYFVLGSMLLSVMTGMPPFEGDTPSQVLMNILSTTPVGLNDGSLPPSMVPLVEALMNRNASERLTDPKEVKERLAEAFGKKTKTPAPVPEETTSSAPEESTEANEEVVPETPVSESPSEEDTTSAEESATAISGEDKAAPEEDEQPDAALDGPDTPAEVALDDKEVSDDVSQDPAQTSDESSDESEDAVDDSQKAESSASSDATTEPTASDEVDEPDEAEAPEASEKSESPEKPEASEASESVEVVSEKEDESSSATDVTKEEEESQAEPKSPASAASPSKASGMSPVQPSLETRELDSALRASLEVADPEELTDTKSTVNELPLIKAPDAPSAKGKRGSGDNVSDTIKESKETLRKSGTFSFLDGLLGKDEPLLPELEGPANETPSLLDLLAPVVPPEPQVSAGRTETDSLGSPSSSPVVVSDQDISKIDDILAPEGEPTLQRAPAPVILPREKSDASEALREEEEVEEELSVEEVVEESAEVEAEPVEDEPVAIEPEEPVAPSAPDSSSENDGPTAPEAVSTDPLSADDLIEVGPAEPFAPPSPFPSSAPAPAAPSPGKSKASDASLEKLAASSAKKGRAASSQRATKKISLRKLIAPSDTLETPSPKLPEEREIEPPPELDAADENAPRSALPPILEDLGDADVALNELAHIGGELDGSSFEVELDDEARLDEQYKSEVREESNRLTRDAISAISEEEAKAIVEEANKKAKPPMAEEFDELLLEDDLSLDPEAAKKAPVTVSKGRGRPLGMETSKAAQTLEADLGLAPSPAALEKASGVAKQGASAQQPVAGPGEKVVKTLRRKGQVRYYEQMNPGKVFPLLVTILEAEKYVKIPDISGVAQKESDNVMEIKESSPIVRIVPIIPGGFVSPPEATVNVRQKKVDAEFWVAPQSLGTFDGSARIQIWHEGKLKDEIKLPMRVRKQAVTQLLGVTSAVSTFTGMFLKVSGAGAKPPSDPGVTGTISHHAIGLISSSGLWVGLLLLLSAIGCYFWLRPRKGDEIEKFLTTELH